MGAASDADDRARELGSLASVLRDLAAAPAATLARGTRIDDQYEIERVLGSGGMGIVYLARDLRLERNVAIKIARDGSPIALARASREAVSLARLSHPNVVAVHQVGALDGHVYVAMEYVPQTARAWCAAAPRTPREVLALYLAVGDGLAAAHAIDLVHRDFKPDNVLVGEDGRGRVADFGLAMDARAEIDAIAGTPAYMPPEQARGEELDARADQYAFCVALREALAATQTEPDPAARDAPSADVEPEPDANATMAGSPSGRRQPDANATVASRPSGRRTSAPPTGTRPSTAKPRKRAQKIPRHVAAALERGASADRDARWPSLAPLLAELRRDPARRRRVLALGAGAPLLAAGAVAAVLLSRQTAAPAVDPCLAGTARIAQTWNPASAARLRAAFVKPGAPAWVGRVDDGVAASLDGYAKRWSAAYATTCHAPWTADMRDRGMACLATDEHALDAAIATLPDTGAALTDSVLAVLPWPEACTDLSYLTTQAAPPTDPAVAARLTDALAAYNRATMASAGNDPVRARAALATISRLGVIFAPLAAHIEYRHAMLDRVDGDTATAATELQTAYFDARAAGEREVATDAAREAALALLDLSRDLEAAHWAKLATTEDVQLGDLQLEARVTAMESAMAIAQGDGAQAIQLATRAIDLIRANAPGTQLAEAYLVRARARTLVGQFPDALADLDAAVRAVVDRTGVDEHPMIAVVETERSRVLDRQGELAAAVAAGERAVATAQHTIAPGADSEVLDNALGTLGIAYAHAKRFPEAIALIDRSLAGNRKAGERTYNVASDLNSRCDLQTQMHAFPAAVADCTLAADIFAQVAGATADEVGLADFNRANAELAQGHWALAKDAAEHARAILAKQETSAAPFQALVLRAEAEAGMQQLSLARDDLAAAVAGLTAHTAPAEWIARATEDLADPAKLAIPRTPWLSR